MRSMEGSVPKYPEPTEGSIGASGAKRSWPEVVGMSAEKAKEIILRDKPDAQIEVIPVDAMVPLDFNPNRIFILVAVARTPTVG
ncbi:subtilisin-chymotrypsin inhibitor CI-1B [Hordeum vulgare subsp. vulgare]|uniref:Subtilisin-chymotrypsin inhibitor CI-1B n=2 Tax=Hordeum vulgare TaxID=4513 RepID=ICIB_HORVU|nr:subtilisin-chymotrypsin inhibitor CI-1B [Hordeum vulgare subsp. vulgare]XP_044955298.1 subtilisin-chymotrypsin inhibitor CI-1B [Hordeum vulgare subsp. vulgare]P16063.1 RecName: Full=Subtilisin-chymotrypsin inhibitor CI-1B [Hordeum vulgare]AAA32946.1 chymotrypsin inhibitor [Hordeum vulgare]